MKDTVEKKSETGNIVADHRDQASKPLAVHNIGHTKKSNKCIQCDYVSSWKNNLRTHLKTHSGEKLSKCNQCENASSKTDNFRTHLKSPSGEKSNKLTNVTIHFLKQAI